MGKRTNGTSCALINELKKANFVPEVNLSFDEGVLLVGLDFVQFVNIIKTSQIGFELTFSS